MKPARASPSQKPRQPMPSEKPNSAASPILAIMPSMMAIARFIFGRPEPLMRAKAPLRVAAPKKFRMIGSVRMPAIRSTDVSLVKRP